MNSLAKGWVNNLAQNPLTWVNYLAQAWVNYLAKSAFWWVICLAVDTPGSEERTPGTAVLWGPSERRSATHLTLLTDFAHALGQGRMDLDNEKTLWYDEKYSTTS